MDENSPTHDNSRPPFRSFRANRDSEEFSFPTLASLKAPPHPPPPPAPAPAPAPTSPEEDQEVPAPAPAFIRESVEGLEGLITAPAEEVPPESQASVTEPVESGSPRMSPTSPPSASVADAAASSLASAMLSLIPLSDLDLDLGQQQEEELDSQPLKRVSLASLPSELAGSPAQFFRRGEVSPTGPAGEAEGWDAAAADGHLVLQESFLDFLSQPQRPDWQSPRVAARPGGLGAGVASPEVKRRRLDSSICVVVPPPRLAPLEERTVLELLGVQLSPCSSSAAAAAVETAEASTLLPRLFASLEPETDHTVFALTERVLELLQAELGRKLEMAAVSDGEAAAREGTATLLVEEISRRRDEAEFVKRMGEHARQVQLQMEARTERRFVEEVELRLGEYLVKALAGCESFGKCEQNSFREQTSLRRELVRKLGRLVEKVERKRNNVQGREQELTREYTARGEAVAKEVEMKRMQRLAVGEEIKAYEKAVEDQLVSAKDLYQKKLENFRLFKEHFLNYGWTVCRDGVKEMVVQIPRVRLHFQVLADDRGNHKVVEYKKLVEGPYSFLNSSLVNFPLSAVVKSLVEAQLPHNRRFSFSPETLSGWASEAIRTASAIEELAQTVQNVGELLESNRWVDRPKSLVNVKASAVAGGGGGSSTSRRATAGGVSGGVAVEVLVCNYKQQLRLHFQVPSLAHTDSELLAQELSLTVRVVGPCHPELKRQLVENLKTTKTAWARRVEGIETAVDAALKLFKHW